MYARPIGVLKLIFFPFLFFLVDHRRKRIVREERGLLLVMVFPLMFPQGRTNYSLKSQTKLQHPYGRPRDGPILYARVTICVSSRQELQWVVFEELL